MKKLLDFLAYSNVFVSVCVASLSALTMLLMHLKPDYPLLLLLFCATLFVYNFHRLYGMSLMEKQPSGQRHRWSGRHARLLKTLLYAACLGALLLLWEVSANSIALLALLSVLVLGYAFPFLPFSRYKRLRELPYIKSLLVSFVVTVLTVSIPLLEDGGMAALHTAGHAGLFAARLCFVLAITIPFDIRDLDDDREYHLKTLPLLFGVAATRIVSLCCLLLFCIASLWHLAASATLHLPLLSALLLSAACPAVAILKTDQQRTEQFFTYLLEGSMLLQFILFWLAIQSLS